MLRNLQYTVSCVNIQDDIRIRNCCTGKEWIFYVRPCKIFLQNLETIVLEPTQSVENNILLFTFYNAKFTLHICKKLLLNAHHHHIHFVCVFLVSISLSRGWDGSEEWKMKWNGFRSIQNLYFHSLHSFTHAFNMQHSYTRLLSSFIVSLCMRNVFCLFLFHQLTWAELHFFVAPLPSSIFPLLEFANVFSLGKANRGGK